VIDTSDPLVVRAHNFGLELLERGEEGMLLQASPLLTGAR